MIKKEADIPKNRAESGRDWTKGNIFRNLLSLAWPMIINESLWSMGPIIDMIWVGRIGAASIAGVGVAGIVMMLLMVSIFGLSTGARAMVSRFIGAGDAKGANHVAQQAFVISGVCSLVLAVIVIFLAEPILILFGLEPDVVHQGAAYLRIQLAGSVVMSFWVMAEMIMYASGDGATPMKISVVARFVHLIFAPCFVLGWWIFPQMGVSGAAIANVISYFAGAVLGLWALFRGRTRLQLTMKNFHIDLNTIWRMVKIGIPASVSGIQRSLGNLALMWLIIPFGTLAVAAHGLSQRIEGILFMPSMGLGMASGVLVGQNLGAGQPERAEKSGWLATGLVTCIMIAGSMIILLWAEGIIRIFSSEPGLVEIASTFLRIAAAGYLMIGFNIVLMNSISSAGDTLPPMIISLAMTWLTQLPLAYFLPKITNLGVLGVRWAIVMGLFVASVAFITYFRLGRWKRKKI
ncbi:MATE family efflux transporter [Chloroflexota bacterium]